MPAMPTCGTPPAPASLSVAGPWPLASPAATWLCGIEPSAASSLRWHPLLGRLLAASPAGCHMPLNGALWPL